MNIKKMNIEELLPAKYNPRKDLQAGDKEYEKIKRSIEEFGYVEPIIFNALTHTIVGGHQRLKVLKELGYTEVDVVIIEETLEREKALNIALNKIEGEWDLPSLKDLLQDLDTGNIDMDLTGFDDFEIEQMMTQIVLDVNDDDFLQDTEITKEKEKKEIVCPHCGERIEV